MMKTKLRSVLLYALFLVCLASLVSLAFAVTQTGYSGYWDTVSYPDYVVSSKSVCLGRANVTFGGIGAVTDGQGIELILHVESLAGDRAEWYWLNGVERFYFVLALNDGVNPSVFANLYVAEESGIIVHTSEVKYGVFWETPPSFKYFQNAVDLTNSTFVVQIKRISATQAVAYYAVPVGAPEGSYAGGYIEPMRFVYTQNFTVASGFWTNPSAYLYIGHDGVGHFNVSFEESVGTLDSLSTGIDTNESSPWGDFLNFATSVFSFASSLFGMLVAIVSALMPVLPWFFVAYLADAVLTSISESSVQPVGKFFSTLFDMLVQVGQLVYGFAQAVAEALPF
jgi:hypothetical protein